jgi:hypothetical protein
MSTEGWRTGVGGGDGDVYEAALGELGPRPAVPTPAADWPRPRRRVGRGAGTAERAPAGDLRRGGDERAGYGLLALVATAPVTLLVAPVGAPLLTSPAPLSGWPAARCGLVPRCSCASGSWRSRCPRARVPLSGRARRTRTGLLSPKPPPGHDPRSSPVGP